MKYILKIVTENEEVYKKICERFGIEPTIKTILPELISGAEELEQSVVIEMVEKNKIV